MKAFRKAALLVLAIGFAMAGTAGAAVNIIPKSGDITVSEVWTKETAGVRNVYDLTASTVVKNGATLTIEAGTLVASTATGGGAGSLAITRGSRLYVLGTAQEPVIFTTNQDVATWTGSVVNAGVIDTVGDPKTGTWREAANEWGSIAIMGKGYIAEDAVPGNVPYPAAGNEADMEGLVPGFVGDPDTRYGGNMDDDNSGTIQYLSLRYGGRVIGLNDELNGFSLGGVGRETEINHVDVMNNVDDGIEIWGGTVELKYCTIWNIGDDTFDLDQGWRGKAQFIFIVQGYSVDDSQGSGVGDNCFEHDGAEDSDFQPCTTAVIYNATVVGQPGDGDGGTAWRDNCRIQYRKCIWMDLGAGLVQFDNIDGDGANGYGHNGTLSWAATWTTDWSEVYNPANVLTGGHANMVPPIGPGFTQPELMAIYAAQTSGKLAEIVDSVFFRNLAAGAYTESDARGVTVGGGSNPAKNNVVASFNVGSPDDNMPIAALTRDFSDADGDGDPGVTRGGKIMFPVVTIDPRAANDAVSAATFNIDDEPVCGFFTNTPFRGAFSPDHNWARGWTAADAFGFFGAPDGDVVAAPPQELELKFTVVCFDTEDGTWYQIEVSDDGTDWAPFKVVEGTGGEICIQDLAGFDGTKLYRVLPL